MTRGPWRPWQSPDEREAREKGAEAADNAPSVFDAVQSGYETLNERPALIAVPLALDLLLWLGPRVTSPALFNWLAHWPAESTDGAALAQTLYERGQTAEVSSGIAQVWNGFGVSNLIGSLDRGAFANVTARPAAVVGPWYIALLIILALVIAGLWLKALFVTPIAQLVRQEPFDVRRAMRASGVATMRVLLLLVVVIGMLALTLMPVAMLGAAFVLAGINGLGLVLLAALIPVFWALFYGAFAMDAIFLEGVGPMRALYLSYRVVRRNVWPTAGFIALSLVISRMIPLALTRVVQQPVGVALAIIAHAYVAAGLAAGSLIFYQGRRARVGDVRPEGGAEETAPGRRVS